ncbi:uncharacterized protein LOC119079542 [Bradysia coprophila]|uniref:uncharacterized protein LOC119079542 n=1 Tax=Bradysia coprophila TaxID=38358 RepID=UPI00187DC65C|nr:uncharacterized protein LOC119079542 [Bradysia coprophila]
MNRFWNWFTILLVVHYTTSIQFYNEYPCEIDAIQSKTVYNLKYNCNRKQLRKIFSHLSAGAFPPNGKLEGTILMNGLRNQSMWNGKKIKYVGGVAPHDHGTLVNVLFNNRYEMFRANIHRTIAPIDGKESFVLNYKHTPMVFYIVDYLREVQQNVYLGIMTIRPFKKIPVLYFLLEKVEE